MRIFFIGGNLPLAGHSVRSPTVVVRESLRAFLAEGHEVAFQPLLAPTREAGYEEAEAQSLAWASSEGIELLPRLLAPPDAAGATPRLLVRQAVSRAPGLFYPSYAHRHEIARRVEAANADVVFHLWCSAAFAACAEVEAPVFAFAGNPDHYSMAARLKHPEIFGIPQETIRNRAKLRFLKAAYRRFEDVVVELGARTRWIACVSDVNRHFYTEHGHPNAFYIENMWTLGDGGPAAAPERGKIVGNIGQQYATGNTFALWFIGTELMPELDRRLGNSYTVNLYGTGSPAPPVAAALRHPRIVNHGFVDDIDAELRSARVFLLANNNNPDFLAAHTRVLHAWSLGSCMVAHANMALATPEIVHGENALLGRNAAELAEHVAAALEDDDLRARIAEGGRRTFERDFTPPKVIRKVLDRIEQG